MSCDMSCGSQHVYNVEIRGSSVLLSVSTKYYNLNHAALFEVLLTQLYWTVLLGLSMLFIASYCVYTFFRIMFLNCQL